MDSRGVFIKSWVLVLFCRGNSEVEPDGGRIADKPDDRKGGGEILRARDGEPSDRRRWTRMDVLQSIMD
jgi:hypothetical protein